MRTNGQRGDGVGETPPEGGTRWPLPTTLAEADDAHNGSVVRAHTTPLPHLRIPAEITEDREGSEPAASDKDRDIRASVHRVCQPLSELARPGIAASEDFTPTATQDGHLPPALLSVP
jgi:hypothetical protein